jgi:eukaryotic-like serine/threonine-protein kinase
MTQPRLVGGRYELGELIGYGGMAEVHRGRDIRLGRDVAIKVLRADLARDPSFLNRFRREAQAAAGLNHPSIVSVYDTGEDVGAEGTTQPYIVMEFVEGRTLRDILKAEGRLPARRAMEIVADVAGALDFSHRAGLIHRDVKPANVMITRTGAIKVMDFGIARAVADSSATVTQTANVIGTAQYLSPEQARGESVDARSDVYSTGCLMYELVTGVPPFQGDSPVAVAYQHVRENATAPSSRVPGLPRALDSIVMKALAKNPLNRYQSAGEMRTDLQRALADQPVSAEAVMTDAERTQFISRTPPPTPIPPREQYHDDDRGRRNAWVWVAVVVAVLLVLGGAGFAIWKLNNNDKTPPPTQIAVPNLIGLTVDQANTEVQQLNTKKCKPDETTCGITLKPNERDGATTSDTCDGGQAIKTDGQICTLKNQAGSTVSANTIVQGRTTLYYQLFATATANVPYVIDDSPQDAVDALQKLGLQAQILDKKVNTFDHAAGVVAAQDPANNTTVPQGSTVKLQLSSGQRKLPDVTTNKCSDAASQLNHMGWTSVPVRQGKGTSNTNKVGTVYGMNPTPNNLYGSDKKIVLFCYRYKAPPPTCDSNSPPPVSTPITSPSDTTSSGESTSESGTPSTSETPSTQSTPSSPVGSNGLPYCSS